MTDEFDEFLAASAAEPFIPEERDMLTDEDAMNAIRALLSGKEWDASTIEDVAAIVRYTGRDIADPDDFIFDPEQIVEPMTDTDVETIRDSFKTDEE